MGKLFLLSAISFSALFILNLAWIVGIIGDILYEGVQSIFHDESLIETLILSTYTKWIILADLLWACMFVIFLMSRKKFKNNLELHYLKYKPLVQIKICVVVPTYNEEDSIQNVIMDFKKQKFVIDIIVVDNHSSDNTVFLSEKAGAIVLKKSENKGYAHSVLLGLRESLKTDANVILFTEADGTYNGYDIEKMVSYLANVDMVLGSRHAQILSEKANQNSIMHIWGNMILAKLIQLKYFSLKHLGIVKLTDVGCAMRMMKRECLEKIVPLLSKSDSEQPIASDSIQLHITMLTIENNFRVIEIPLTFNKRIGKSKLRSDEFFYGLKWGFKFLWFILKS